MGTHRGAPRAERDLEEIFFEVKERHGLLVAERVYNDLLRTFALLADMPETWTGGLDLPVAGALRIRADSARGKYVVGAIPWWNRQPVREVAQLKKFNPTMTVQP